MTMNASTVGLAVAAAATGVQTVVTNTLHVGPPLWHGLPVDVLMWACAGAIASLAYMKPDGWAQIGTAHGALMKATLMLAVAFTLAVNAFLTTLFVMALPHVPMVGTFISEVPPMALAGLGSAFFQPLLRGGGAALGRWVRSKTPETPKGGEP